MKYIKKKVNQFHLAIILSCIFALLVGTGVVLGLTLFKDEPNTPAQKPEVLEGESVHYNSTVAYPVIEETDMQSITVENTVKGEGNNPDQKNYFKFERPKPGEAMSIYYSLNHGDADEKIEYIEYLPEIFDKENIDYSSLYAIELNDGYKGIYKLSYLSNALEVAYFRERIVLSNDAEKREKELHAYGLAEGEYAKVTFEYLEYKDENDKVGTLKTHTIKIGEQNISGNGYYFMVDDRNYVYTSTSNHYDYALAGFESFVKSNLVIEGLEIDNGYGPFLTTNFTQWVNQMHENIGDKVVDGSKVIVYSDVITPINLPDESYGATGVIGDGYLPSEYSQIELDLSEMTGDSYERLHRMLVGKKIGSYEQAPLLITLPTRTGVFNIVEFDKNGKADYVYEICKIESILTNDGELCDTGRVVGENNLIKVTYNLKINGKKIGSKYHGVIDISEDFVNSAESQIRASAIGELTTPISIEVNYSKNNSVNIQGKKVMTEIVSILSPDGKDPLRRVTKNCVVAYKYKVIVDGVVTEENKVGNIDFSKVDFTDDSKNLSEKALFAMIEGKTRGKFKDDKMVFETQTYYFQFVYEFLAYSIKSIDYFVTKEMVVSFRFQNYSERDPYYGGSLYENLIDDERKLYGLNASACENIVQMLGGVSGDSESNTANGLAGTETVAVGITPEIMYDKGLYAHTIYFELPRLITIKDGSTDENQVDDYDYYGKIGFNLYISPEQPDNTRFIASDLYDVVAKIDGENFKFLDYEFTDFWARRDMFMMNIKVIDEVDVKLDMSDVYGLYSFEIRHNVENNFDKVEVKVTPDPSVECSDSELLDYMNGKNATQVDLGNFYNSIYEGDPIADDFKPDTIGAGLFKEWIRMIYYTGYTGALSESEKQELEVSTSKALLTLSFKASSNANKYVYEFYRISDRKIAVKLYQLSPSNVKTDTVSDFYISTFAFQKIVRNFLGILNGEIINTDTGYED